MYPLCKSTIQKVCMLAVCTLSMGVSYAYAEGTASVRVINPPGGGEVRITVKNKNGTDAASDTINWTSSSATLVGGWRIADQYIEITNAGLVPFWGIQTYTDNKNSTPAFVGGGNPAGLVRLDNNGITIPMAWRISDKPPSAFDPSDPNYKPEEDPYSPFNVVERDDHMGMTNYLWHFIKDKSSIDDPETTTRNETFVNGEDYITLWNQKGVVWNEGGFAGRPAKAYIYFAARFTTLSIGVQAKTTTLTMEAFHGMDPFPIYVYKDASKTDPAHADDPNATLENHYAPAFMNLDNNNTPTNTADDNIILTMDYATSPYSGAYCMKISWNGKGTDYNNDGDYLDPGESPGWAGATWLEPPPATDGSWPTPGVGVGYDLRATRRGLLRFYAKASRTGCSINVHFGRTGDSCGQVPAISNNWVPITTSWASYIIDIPETKDMSSVSLGFSVVLNDTHDGIAGSPGYTVYLDDVRYELWPA